MSFFKHIGTKASKFQFNIWIENVIGVYPSSYSTDEHCTEGIYVILKRRNKSFRTKIALPASGGHVPVNDCIKFTSTLYQKKTKYIDEQTTILPKPFILRVCNNTHQKIRWETTIDLCDYASVFGVDSQESFTLKFCYKSGQSSHVDSIQNVPIQITVRVHIKSTWLQNVDNISQTSTDSVSRISSSMQSDLSDFENYKLFDNIPNKAEPTNQIETAFSNQHQHKYHNLLFAAVPEEHSTYNSPHKSSHNSPQMIINPTKVSENVNDTVSLSPVQQDTAAKPAVLQSVQNLNLPPPPPRLHTLSSDMSLGSKSPPARVRNLSFLSPEPNALHNSEGNIFSPPLNKSVNNSGVFMENELIRIDKKMQQLSVQTNNEITEKITPEIISEDVECDGEDLKSIKIEINPEIDIQFIIDIIGQQCIDDMNKSKMEERLWNNLIPKHCAILFRCFVHWNVFEENINNTQLILQGTLSRISMVIHAHIKNDLEQSYWLLRLTTMIYWLHLYYPQQLMSLSSPEKTPQLRRCETFEPIQSPVSDDNRTTNPISDDISNDNNVSHTINSGNQSTETDSNNSTDSFHSAEEYTEHKQKQSELGETPTINLQYWFVEKLTSLCHLCFDNIIDNTLQKLSRIPFEHVFDENEFGEQGSNTMDMIFAVMNSVWFLWEDIKLFNVYRIQICRQVLQYSVIHLINNLLMKAEYCTIAGGFRLKVIKSMIADWTQSNSSQNTQVFGDIMSSLDEVSALLLTCAVVQNGKELLKICPSLSAAQINQILNNYNSEATNEPLSAEILTPILEIAAAEMPRNEQRRISISNISFCKQSMKGFNINQYLLPKIYLSDIPIPYQITKHRQFKFLMNIDHNQSVVL